MTDRRRLLSWDSWPTKLHDWRKGIRIGLMILRQLICLLHPSTDVLKQTVYRLMTWKHPLLSIAVPSVEHTNILLLACFKDRVVLIIKVKVPKRDESLCTWCAWHLYSAFLHDVLNSDNSAWQWSVFTCLQQRRWIDNGHHSIFVPMSWAILSWSGWQRPIQQHTMASSMSICSREGSWTQA